MSALDRFGIRVPGVGIAFEKFWGQAGHELYAGKSALPLVSSISRFYINLQDEF